MNSHKSPLFRAHSKKYLRGETGIIANPNLGRIRRPRDIPITIHQFLRDWFLARFGVDFRGASLFCTGDFSIATGYRTAYSAVIAIVPVKDYALCFSPRCKDLFGHYQFHWSAPNTPFEKIGADLDALGFVHYQNDGLTAAAESGNEVMIVAERFNYTLAQPDQSQRGVK